MRALVIAVVVVLVLVLLGWLRFSTPSGNPTLQIDTAEIKEDTGEMVEQGKSAIGRVREEVNEDADEEVRQESPAGDADTPTESPEP